MTITQESTRKRTPAPSAPGLGFQPASHRGAQPLEHGGPIRGPGTGTSDSIEAEVPQGSYIMPADSTAQIGDDALAQMGRLGFGPNSVGARTRQAAPPAPARGLGMGPLLKGKGVPVALSNGEYEMPPEQVHQIGVQALDAMKAQTHTPVPPDPARLGIRDRVASAIAAAPDMAPNGFHAQAPGTPAPATTVAPSDASAGGAAAAPPAPQAAKRYADGGMIDDPNRQAGSFGAVRRVGNSYSGGNVSGSISVNGQAPGGTVSTTDWASGSRGAGAYTKPPVIGAPPSNVPATTAPTTTSAPPSIVPRTQLAEVPPGMGRNPSKFMGAADVVPQDRLAAPPAGPAAAGARGFPLARAAGPAAVALGTAMEGQQVLDVARDPNATGLDVAAQAARGVGRLASAGAGAAGGAALGAMTGPLAPAAVPLGAMAGGALGYWSADKAIEGAGKLADAAMRPSAAGGGGSNYPTSGGAAFGVFPQMPRGGTNANPPATQAQVRAVDNSPANAAAIAAAPTQSPLPATRPEVAPPPFGGGPVADPNDKIGIMGAEGVTSADRIAQMQRDGQHLRDLGRLQGQIDQFQGMTSGAPGLVAIDGAGEAADARQKFFDEAALRNAAAKGSWSPRHGYQGDPLAVKAALAPIENRAQAETTQLQERGALQRAQLQELGLDMRERTAAAQRGQANEIAARRLAVEEAKDGRAAMDAAQVQRLRDLVVSGNPTQQKMAASKLAALQGKGLEGAGKPLTEGQSKALLFGARMQSANETLSGLQADGKVFSTPGANTPYLRGAVNAVNSDQGQQLDQAKRDFLNAVLRRESGAVIADSEFDNGSRQYFPQVGDGAKVIAQKARNRELAMRGILAEVPDADTRIAEIRSSMAPSQQQGGEQAEPPQLAELRRRAAGNPALAQRLQQMGY